MAARSAALRARCEITRSAALQGCPAAVGRPKGLRYERPPLISQCTLRDYSPRRAPNASRYDVLMLGETVSHYRVLQKLGSGGMGEVYLCEDLTLGRRVALKFLAGADPNDRQSIDRFLREARTASALNHPNICTIHEIGNHEGRPFLVLELLEGHTLTDEIGG